jgi:hypothetical protein
MHEWKALKFRPLFSLTAVSLLPEFTFSVIFTEWYSSTALVMCNLHCACYIFSYCSEAFLMAFEQNRCTIAMLLQTKTQQYQPTNYMLKSTQHVSAAVGHHQAKLEQSLGIISLRTLWDPISFTLLITLNAINRLMY